VTRRYAGSPAVTSRVKETALSILSLYGNPISMSFRGAEADEEPRSAFVFGARFLSLLGMTVCGSVSHRLPFGRGRTAAGYFTSRRGLGEGCKQL